MRKLSSGQSTPEELGRRAKASTGREDDELAREATRILRTYLVRHGVDYKSLARLLALEGESSQVLANKVNRGRFTFAFFLRVMRALGEDTVDIGPRRLTGQAQQGSMTPPKR